MAVLEERYITPVFSDAAQLPKAGQLSFLSHLRGYTAFRRDSQEDDITFRDMTVFALNAADMPLHAFAQHLVISPNLLRLWTHGQNLPYDRAECAVQIIDTALYQNGWVGKPPCPPVTDGSNVVPLRPATM